MLIIQLKYAVISYKAGIFIQLVPKFVSELCRTFKYKVQISDTVMPPPIIIVTNCTNRKRSVEKAIALDEVSLNGSLEIVAIRWAALLENALRIKKAGDVYSGRSIAEAKKAKEVVAGELYVISAGLGIVHADEPIPAYNLTVSAGIGSLAPLLNQLSKTPADWWSALNNELGSTRSIASLLNANKNTRLLLALPSSYLELISQELTRLTAAQLTQIRIITSKLGEETLPLCLHGLVLPYDERLEGSKYKGTRSDFPQRALLHFVMELNGHNLDHDVANQKVRNAMETMRARTLPVRTRKNDAEILALLRGNWVKYGGTANRMLRFLRDDVLVACEQSRFRGLWLKVKEELKTEGQEWQR